MEKAINDRSIEDMSQGEQISIPGEDVSEPVFARGAGGKRFTIHPGNREFEVGDEIEKPPGGGGPGAGEASNSGEGDDDFTFQINEEEFLNYMFEDLELPNLVKLHLKGDEKFKYVRAGYSSDGSPSQLSVLRSMRVAKARKIALTGEPRKRLRKCLEELELCEAKDDELRCFALKKEIEALRKRINRIPFLDTYDLRFKLNVKQPLPATKAVMFCLMDVSGSMDQKTKDLAKRFYLLLYLFLQRNYAKTDVIFIRHHTIAKEVDEQEFFYSRETGGTVVSSALNLMTEIIEQRYPIAEWNIYGAQASDGDNWSDDSPLSREILEKRLMPKLQHFSYVEISTRAHQSLWNEYEKLAQLLPERFVLRQIQSVADIYPTFRNLFQKQATP